MSRALRPIKEEWGEPVYLPHGTDVSCTSDIIMFIADQAGCSNEQSDSRECITVYINEPVKFLEYLEYVSAPQLVDDFMEDEGINVEDDQLFVERAEGLVGLVQGMQQNVPAWREFYDTLDDQLVIKVDW